MNAHFAEVLARESATLAGVTDAEKLGDWRDQIVFELMNPASPYALAMRQTEDLKARARFLDSWRRLIARTIDKVLRADTVSPASHASPHSHADTDAHKTAVLILAALHGGATLSQVAQDPWPLNAALDIALAPLTAPED
jgi:hypothetical protein